MQCNIHAFLEAYLELAGRLNPSIELWRIRPNYALLVILAIMIGPALLFVVCIVFYMALNLMWM